MTEIWKYDGTVAVFLILQACNQVESFVGDIGMKESSDYLRRAMAVNQHHDAVTGTEKQHVANDYAKRLHMGRTQCQVSKM